MARQHPVSTMAEETQALILEGIAELKKPVDVPMIAGAFHVSADSARHHLDALVDAGKLRKVKNCRSVSGFYEIPPEKQETIF